MVAHASDSEKIDDAAGSAKLGGEDDALFSTRQSEGERSKRRIELPLADRRESLAALGRLTQLD
ncbi:MAG: hypothetical protein ABS61_12775 [Microbacterium sp. SCN 70-18]|nr:MAG: hypothetical protein ABS61_12775 [Microbacterium sp. SCN 70-18]